MTYIEFDCNRDKNTVSLKISGHAGSGEKGEDLVCCSVSTLGYTCAQCIRDMFFKNKLKKRPTLGLGDGDFFISAKVKKDDYVEALHTLFVIQAGFMLLEKNYPEFVTVAKRLDEAAKAVSEDKSGVLH